MFTKNPFNKKDEVADLIGNILEADYKVKKEELKGNQHKIDMNKNNKIDAHDFKLLRSKGASQKDEEIDPNKVTTDTLKGRAMGKDANPFLSKKVFMDVPGNVKEEVEQIDELSSSTIDSYRKKLGAKIDTTRTTRPSLKAAIQAKNAPIQAKIHNALMKQHQAIRRERGMSEPAKKLPEEVEQIDERELTKGETKEKERIVKGMKKSLSGFKQRYGDRAKSVMYATATKAAKKD